MSVIFRSVWFTELGQPGLQRNSALKNQKTETQSKQPPPQHKTKMKQNKQTNEQKKSRTEVNQKIRRKGCITMKKCLKLIGCMKGNKI